MSLMGIYTRDKTVTIVLCEPCSPTKSRAYDSS